MAWVYLCLAIVLDVAGTAYLKMSEGLSRPGPVLAMVACYLIGFVPLALALKEIEVSVAYAVWSALGTVLALTIGMVWFKEPASTAKVVSLMLIVTGLVFLSLAAE